jgi:hypothetical protein
MDSKKKCDSCKNEFDVWDLVEGCCPECYERIGEEFDRWKNDPEKQRRHHDALANLRNFADDYKKKLAKFRSFLAERGFELTYRQLQDVLCDMDDEGIKNTPETVLEFLRKREGH